MAQGPERPHAEHDKASGSLRPEPPSLSEKRQNDASAAALLTQAHGVSSTQPEESSDGDGDSEP